MAVRVSPLGLLLDSENPRFIVLPSREQSDIRKYLLAYEDVCQLANSINEYGSLLPGERIVVIEEDGNYIAVEGNRRTCSLQLLLDRQLIPDLCTHRIPHTRAELIQNCRTIEVDVLPNREAAMELMSKRHIEGVKQWKPLAKKQFFAAHYANGQTIQNLSSITGISESSIKADIREYKFFLKTYEGYCILHPEYTTDIINVKIDPFWRIFKAKFYLSDGTRVSPKDILQISYDEQFNTISNLDDNLFMRIVYLVFEDTIVNERLNTRNVLTDVRGIQPLLEEIARGDEGGTGTGGTGTGGTGTGGTGTGGTGTGGPDGGGPEGAAFFEHISWDGKLNPENHEHQGLLIAINELHRFSRATCNRQKAYKVFPVATGMILRTVYEQSLKLRLTQKGQWSNYLQTLRNGSFPTLSSMEGFINQNKNAIFLDQIMVSCYDNIIRARDREFLNANIHYPDLIRVTASTLEGIAAGGMLSLIQKIINQL